MADSATAVDTPVNVPSRSPRTRRTTRAVFIGLGVLLLVAPFLFYPVFLMKVLCFALFACAFNLLLGYGGLLSFGHAAYFGMASYVSAYTAKFWGVTPEISIILGTVTGAALGLVVRLARHPAARHLLLHDHPGAGPDGVFLLAADATLHGRRGRHPGGAARQPPRRPEPRRRPDALLRGGRDFFAGLLLIYRIIHSPFGQVLKAIRDNEPRATSLGYRTNQYKLMVFVLSTTLAGLAGATKAIVFQLASLTDVHWSMSGEVVLMTLVGGMGTVFGPIVGALVIVAMENYLATLGAWVTVVQGLIFVLCVLLFRRASSVFWRGG